MAAKILQRARFNIRPHDSNLETLPHEDISDVIVCAVDTNDARELVQSKYRPVVLMGSTHNMRAEVLRCIKPGDMACLRCYNAPTKRLSDETLRDSMSQLSQQELHRLAERANVSVDDAEEYVSSGKCGEAGEALLRSLGVATEQGMPRFAIGFTSMAAGTLLAAETVKLAVADRPDVSPSYNRVVLQFFRPGSNFPKSAYARKETCPACSEGAALKLWRQRYSEHPYNKESLDPKGPP
jgi:molybdopterin/thiamine biosynthesis adenylyltransferase